MINHESLAPIQRCINTQCSKKYIEYRTNYRYCPSCGDEYEFMWYEDKNGNIMSVEEFNNR